MHQINKILKKIIHSSFKIYAYIIVIYCHIFRNLYKLTAKLYPDYIMNVKMIDTCSNKVYICRKNIKEVLNLNKADGTKFYIIHIWNSNTSAVEYYIINDKLLFDIYFDIYMNSPNYLTTRTNIQCIKNIRRYYELNKKENNIYAIIIDNKDVTKLFQKYRSSISIPGNLTAHALYIYYCSKTSVTIEPLITLTNEAIKNIAITCIDYNLDEKIFNYNDLIDVNVI